MESGKSFIIPDDAENGKRRLLKTNAEHKVTVSAGKDFRYKP